jgi:hypothetical protein
LAHLGDVPAVDQITNTSINEQPAIRVLGHYQGAIGDMGNQQYLRYVIQRGDIYYMFTLYAVSANGIPQSMMTADILPLQENDIALFEQMMATIKFNDR